MIRVQNDAVERVERATTMQELHISVVGAIDEISAAAWDACANPAPSDHNSHQEIVYNPFVSHNFLSTIEESQSAAGAPAGSLSTLSPKRPPASLSVSRPAI